MSLLNSILSSINDGRGPAPKPLPVASAPKPTPLPRKDNTALNTTRPQSSSINSSAGSGSTIAPKRKAEDVGRDMKSKAPRVDSASSLPAPVSRSTTSSPAQRQGLPPPPKTQVPYRGTMGGAKPATAATAATPSVPAGKAAAGATPAHTPTSSAPKTGYLAILERAKAAQEAAKQAGQIKHKPAEKLTKKDRLRLQAEAAAAQKGKSVPARAAPGVKGRSKSADLVDSKSAQARKDRKPVDLGYKGTMRAGPTPLPYSGTMRPSGSAVQRKPQPASSRDRYRYASYSDEEDDMKEDEEDYESESDMEAGMDDVDREEEEALRAARREDAEALRQENELKRAKLEKKRKLEQLAANAKKKAARY
ncbi:hypothetical protein AAFC00_002836 [Neodothiora populina]|uniref:SPT2 chromatin protein n=1 Tax=Neodothiora populina TaxID=2781224 RepID=A0ABR3P8E0_9PEZI